MSDTLEVYRGFLSLDFAKALRVSTPLLAELEQAGIIDDNERAMIDSKILPTDKRLELFVRIMPSKNRTCQKSLVEIFSNFQMDQVSDYLRNWIPCLSVRTLIDEPIWKEERSINDPDKAHKVELINGYLKELENKKIEDGDCKDHPEIINIYIRLGELYYEIENYAEAGLYFRRSIQDMDPNNSLKITAEFSLARCYHEMAEYVEAEIFFQQCVLDREKLYGSDNQAVDAFLIFYSYAETLVNENNFKSAEEMYHRSLEIGRKIYGSVSFEVALILRDLGNSYLNDSRLEEAASTLKESYEIQQKIIGPKNPTLSLRILSSMASAYRCRNKPRKAGKICNQALEIYRSKFNGMETIRVCWSLIHVYKCQSDLVNMERICNVALKILDEKFVSENSNNIWRVRFSYELAQVHNSRNRLPDAVAMCKIVLEKLECLPGWKASHNLHYNILFLYIGSCWTLKKYLEFRNGCTDLLNLSLRVYGLKDKHTLAVVEYITKCYCMHITSADKSCNIDIIKLTLQYLMESGGSRWIIDRLSIILCDIEFDLAKSSANQNRTTVTYVLELERGESRWSIDQLSRLLSVIEPDLVKYFANEHRTEAAPVCKESKQLSVSRLKNMFIKR